MQPLIDFFGIKDLIPHGYCLSWSPALLWLNVSSDLLIALAYYSIPVTLIYFIRQRKDLPYAWMVVLFAGFIISCASTHLLSAITIWIPLYWLDGWIKAFTAIVSVATAVLMLWVTPRVLSLPSAAQLKIEIEQKQILEDKLGLFSSLFELTSDCVFLISPKQDFRFVFVNDAVCRHFGMEREELLKWRIPDWDLNFKDQTDLDAIWQDIKGRKDFLFETVSRVASAREVPVEVSMNYLPYQGDEYIAGYFRDITERKKIKETIEVASQYVRSLIEASLDPLVTISADGKIMDVNQATMAVTGMERDQLIGSDFSDYFTEPDLARTGYQQVFSKGYVTDYPLAIRHVSGKVTDVLYNASIYHNPQGEVAGVFAAARDVTDRKLIEQQLETNLYYIRSLIEASLDLMVTLSVAGKIISVNEVTEQLTGVTRTRLLDSDFSLYFVEPETVRTANQKALTNGFVSEYPLTIKHVSGEVFDVLYNASPYRNKSGDIEGLLGVARNITERNKAEEKLRLAASVFAHAWEGILITTTDGTIIDVNNAFSRITSYSREEVLGQNPRIFSSGRQSKDFYAAMWNNLIKKNHWYGEVWNRRKNGEVYAVMETISVVCDAQGNVSHYVAMISDITLLKEHQSELEHIAHYDALTSLPNRVLLADRLRQGMIQAHRQLHSLAVVFVDLDGFKAINDSYGHDAGDQLLITAANRMKHVLREGDTFARIGGDEFVAVLLDQANITAIIPLLTRLLAAAARPVQFGDLSLQVSASLGVTFYPQIEAIDAEQLLRQADQSMYQAKQAGKNGYHFFNVELDQNVRSHYESLERIRRALAKHEFVLYYQPKVNMHTGVVIGAEALIRWQHPDKNLLLPGEFLPVIEDHPLAVEVGEWVIDTALTQIESWQAAGLNIPVSVNVGARQLQQVDFVERLRERLAAHPTIKSGDLVLEVLETSALELAGAAQVINACRELGVMFALDDFGTGYSSLTYLKCLPVTEIKIDQSFVRNMLEDPDDMSILEGVIGLANAFRLQTIAEGVEKIEHGTMLLQLGCSLAQGYAIARPMPAHLLPGWAAAWHPDPAWTESPSFSNDVLPLIFTGVEHSAWCTAIRSYLKDKCETPPSLNNPQYCRFCRWLEANTLSRFSAQPAFEIIGPLHRQMHALAEELCELHDSGRNRQSLAKLKEFYNLRNILQEKLKELTQEYLSGNR